MPRITPKPEDIAEPVELVAAIRARRGGKLNAVDRMLMHAPPLAKGWNDLFLAVRTQVTLPDKYREIAVCGVAVLHGSTFEVDVHAPLFLKAGGTQAQLEGLRTFEASSKNAGLFDERERAVMRLTIESTRHCVIDEQTFAEVRHAFPDDRQLVELIVVIASYNMSARLIGALQIE